MIKADEKQFPAGMMCRLLSVSRSGYYDWRHRPLSERDQTDQVLAAEIKRVFDDTHGAQVRDNGWRAKAAKKYLDTL